MDVVVHHAPHFDPESAERLAFERFAVAGRAVALPSERDQNFRLTTDDGREFVLRIANATERLEVLDFEDRTLDHLAMAAPALALPRVLRSRDGTDIEVARGADGRSHFVRLLTWVDGEVLARATPHTETLLDSLGRRLGQMNRALDGFSHPAQHREFAWNLTTAGWVADEAARVFTSPERRALLASVVADYGTDVRPKTSALRRRIIHGDWNDYNVIVEPRPDFDRHVIGVVDFGDLVDSWVVADLAVACAYAMLGKPDPLAAAAAIVRGFHAELPLEPVEVDVLFALIRMRLALSVTMAARQVVQAPDNAYLLVSQQDTWPLLERLAATNAEWARCVFRQACGWEPSASNASVVAWLRAHEAEAAPVMGRDLRTTPLVVLDLGVGSLDVRYPSVVQDVAPFSAHVDRLMAEAQATYAIGRYDEARLVYTTELFRHPNNWRDENRTVHLGVDIFAPPGAEVFAPLDGVVYSAIDNAQPGDYGPTIILEHSTGREMFYSLYGHLSRASLAGMVPGRRIAKGSRVAWLGDASVNGGWPPHLHFQLMTHMLGRYGEFPGVAAPSERDAWLSLCPDPNILLHIEDRARPTPAPDADAKALLARRRTSLGRNLSLSYRQPVAIVRGSRQYLYDAEGRRYTDCVNNVPHVGHNHPHVVEAVSRQLAVLNTNTRYLHETIVDYAERLTALMPPPLSVCYFVCSGSEANELALRLARAYTGRKDLVVVDGGYHGNTTSLVEISPYKFNGRGGAGAPDYVHVAAMPDPFRGPFRGCDEECGRRYGHEVQRVIERAEANGRHVGAFICESLLGCGGQIVLPDGYLRSAYAAIRAAGGVAIADEVQVGFGRVGTHVWGFDTQGVTPDIVTLGKPIGNGFPLGAVVTTPEIADAFDNGMEYFNTFGGSQAACAAGLAVLDVMKDEALQAHALDVGRRLMAGLSELQDEHPLIGDVRGMGFYIGVELVRDRETLDPAAAQADYIVNRLRDLGFLVSTDGPWHNVLKLKPPMPFSSNDATRLVEALAGVLDEDAARPQVGAVR
jgi:4-aminobutyrate aminotransferase-like enzyme/Ser/Thr protein kinase RdoA (MazF antagonist)